MVVVTIATWNSNLRNFNYWSSIGSYYLILRYRTFLVYRLALCSILIIKVDQRGAIIKEKEVSNCLRLNFKTYKTILMVKVLKIP